MILNVDEWVDSLYEETTDENFTAHANTVLDFMFGNIAKQIINAGIDVIFDTGPWTKDVCRTTYQNALEITPDVIFHTIVLDMDIARQRLINHNNDKNNPHKVGLDFFDNNCWTYEPITPDEGFIYKEYFQNEVKTRIFPYFPFAI